MTPLDTERALYTVQARTVQGFCAAYGVSKSTVYELLGREILTAVKYGKRTLILEDSAQEWFKSLPKATK
jgi:excisionase family DNA binding protein